MAHTSKDVLVHYLDSELSPSEILTVERHLNACEDCRSHFISLRRTSGAFDTAFLSFSPVVNPTERSKLADALTKQEIESNHYRLSFVGKPQGKRTRVFSFLAAGRKQLVAVAGLAACLAVGVISVNHQWTPQRVVSTKQSTSVSATPLNAYEIDGEKFWALPYSNSDLPVTARVVQMEVPVASLAHAGIITEPYLSRAAQPDRSVIADVLLGLDGQPVGVHVVNLD